MEIPLQRGTGKKFGYLNIISFNKQKFCIQYLNFFLKCAFVRCTYLLREGLIHLVPGEFFIFILSTELLTFSYLFLIE
jgi:hypothetical protein